MNIDEDSNIPENESESSCRESSHDEWWCEYFSFLKIKVNMMNNDVKIVVPEDKTEYDASWEPSKYWVEWVYIKKQFNFRQMDPDKQMNSDHMMYILF